MREITVLRFLCIGGCDEVNSNHYFRQEYIRHEILDKEPKLAEDINAGNF